MDEVRSKRDGIVRKLGGSSILALSDELRILGVDIGDQVDIAVRGGRIEIERKKESWEESLLRSSARAKMVRNNKVRK